MKFEAGNPGAGCRAIADRRQKYRCYGRIVVGDTEGFALRCKCGGYRLRSLTAFVDIGCTKNSATTMQITDTVTVSATVQCGGSRRCVSTQSGSSFAKTD